MNHSVEYGSTAVVGDVTTQSTPTTSSELVEVRKALKHRRFSTYRNVLMRSSYRLWFLNGLTPDEKRDQVLRSLGVVTQARAKERGRN